MYLPANTKSSFKSSFSSGLVSTITSCKGHNTATGMMPRCHQVHHVPRQIYNIMSLYMMDVEGNHVKPNRADEARHETEHLVDF